LRVLDPTEFLEFHAHAVARLRLGKTSLQPKLTQLSQQPAAVVIR
jgi:hypothetical protein